MGNGLPRSGRGLERIQVSEVRDNERVFYERQFLNSEEHGGTAFVEATIRAGRHSDSSGWIDANFSVADCSRVVDLDFDVYGDSDENVRQKLNRLEQSVRQFKAAMLAALENR